MIEPTEEYVEAYRAALRKRAQELIDDVQLVGAHDMTAYGLAAVLALVERDQAGELADLRALFQLQWTRSREAEARWRAEDPEARANVWPDLGVLLRWLMDDADKARGQKPEAPRCGHHRRGLECELAEGHSGRHARASWEEWS